MRIALITTGKTELRGLPPALTNLFPGHEFLGIEDVPGRPFRSFTSGRLPPPPEGCPTVVDHLIARAAELVDPDLATNFTGVVVVDDLELVNRDQTGVVVDVFRAAAVRHLELFARYPARRSALAAALRARVSFHVVRPMIESWFFGAPAALSTVGVSAVPYHVRAGDHEDFETTDRHYIAELPSACPRWLRTRYRDDRPKWIGAGSDRIFHPKGYLQWLMIDGSHECCTRYSEAHAGASALAAIDWARLLGNPNGATYTRALVSDLAAMLGQDPAITSWSGTEAPETSVHTSRAAPVLRNL
jgi:hypothetical protein